MIQSVFIIGATGRVGNSLVRQIIEKGDMSCDRHTNPTRIVGLASSSHFFYSLGGISPQKAYNFASRDFNNAPRYRDISELIEIANYGRKKEGTLVFIDATAAQEPLNQFHLDVINKTPHGIVTANKNPITLSSYDAFQQLTKQPRRYGYRCSVMAGAEAVPFLQDLKDLNDKLCTIEGCFSGTLGYITSELEKDLLISDIIREAHVLGYTEPHPRDDLLGVDVAKKLCILARTAGYDVSMDSIKISPFVSREFLLEDNADAFLKSLNDIKHINAMDANVADRMHDAKKRGSTLRYVARMDARKEKPELEVSLQEVPKDSHLGHIPSGKNKIVITSEAYPSGYSIESIGAGLDVTARNIRRDLLTLLPERSF